MSIYKKASAEDLEVAVWLAETGVRPAVIARVLGVSFMAVSYWRKIGRIPTREPERDRAKVAKLVRTATKCVKEAHASRATPFAMNLSKIGVAKSVLEAGGTLVAAAESVGCSHRTIQVYQEQGYLPVSISKHGGADKWLVSPWVEILAEAQRLVDGGCGYSEIGERLGFAASTVRRWGEKGLLAGRCVRTKRQPTHFQDDRKFLEARKLSANGVSNKDIALRMQVAPSTVCRWRQKKLLATVGVKRQGPGVMEREDTLELVLAAQALVNQGQLADAVAEAVDVSRETIVRWLSIGVLEHSAETRARVFGPRMPGRSG